MNRQEQIERNERLIAEFTSEPRQTLQALGDRFGLSRERVRQIALRAGAVRGPRPTREPPVCAREGCSKRTRRNTGKFNVYCSPEHRTPPPVIKQCTTCGDDIAIPLREAKYKTKYWYRNPIRKKPQSNWFCNKQCQGIWLGATHGFNGTERKQRYDYPT